MGCVAGTLGPVPAAAVEEPAPAEGPVAGAVGPAKMMSTAEEPAAAGGGGLQQERGRR